MTSAIFTIGTELTRGELNDKNGGWLADALTSLGHEVTEIATVDDDDERISETFRRLSQNHRVIISTGGLGPTTDDRTSACVAKALGVPLVRDEASLQTIQKLFEAHGRVMSEGNKKQADFPEGATILPNSRGSAPGFLCALGEALIFVLPGVPGEMRAMFEQSVRSFLPKIHHEQTCIRLRCFGIAEAEVNDRLAGIEENFQITLGYRASNSEIEIKVLSKGNERSVVEQNAEAAALVVEERLGPAIYTRGPGSLSLTLGELLCERHLTLGLAESCTGGLLSQLITENSGASAYFKGGVCSYSNAIKERLLGVPSEDLRVHGAVSDRVAQMMAEGARAALDVDLALSITGIAGPSGGTVDKPVGVVHFGLAGSFETVTEKKIFRGPRATIQRRAADHGLWMLHSALLK